MTDAYRRNKAWRDRLQASLIEKFGGCCEECGALAPLEFAHKEPTELHGKGRGRDRRLMDVKKNIDKYRLLCSDCHAAFDQGFYRRKRDMPHQEMCHAEA